MSMGFFAKLRDDYVVWHAKRIEIPTFAPGKTLRKKVIFSGRVQMVGFRLELYTIAQRLALKGWVKNLEDGNVEAEIQGEESKITFLINCMQSLKRASVKKVSIVDAEINEGDEDFNILR